MGCDGTHLYFDGSSCIAANGKLVAIAPEGSYEDDVIVLTESVDIAKIRSQRSATGSFAQQASNPNHRRLPRIPAAICLSDLPISKSLPSPMFSLHKVQLHDEAENEFASIVPLWMYDILRKTGGTHSGFYLTVSTTVEALAMVAVLSLMAQRIMRGRDCSNSTLFTDTFGSAAAPADHRELTRRLVHCASLEPLDKETRAFLDSVGVNYHSVDVSAFKAAQEECFRSECLADEAIDFDTRKFIGEKCEELLSRKIRQNVRPTGKTLFVLNTSCLDDFMEGTTSRLSSDLTPLGGVSRAHLYAFIKRMRNEESMAIPQVPLVIPKMASFFSAQEIRDLVHLKMEDSLGPVGLFRRLLTTWNTLEPAEIADKVKAYFSQTGRLRRVNQPNSPMLHMDSISHDGYHSDIRPIIYASFSRQFEVIDLLTQRLGNRKNMDSAFTRNIQRRILEFGRVTSEGSSPSTGMIKRLSGNVFRD